jgi:hypothetical protein
MIVATVVSAGHSRSQKIVQRARRNAEASCPLATGSVLRCGGAGWLVGVSVTKVSAEKLRMTTG